MLIDLKSRFSALLALALLAGCGGGGSSNGTDGGAGIGGGAGTGTGGGTVSGTGGGAGAGTGGGAGAGTGTGGTGAGTGGSAGGGTGGNGGNGGNGGAGGAAPADCRTGGACPALMYCDLADGHCKNGCGNDSNCGANGSCDLTRHACTCATSAHDCGGVCASNTSPDTCGTSCTPCALPADPNALATTCTNGACGFSCKPGFAVFGSGCISVGSWSAGPTIPTARIYFAAVGGLDGRVYVLGGQNATTGAPSAVVEAYTPSTSSWKTLASMPTARSLLWAVAVGTSASNFAIYALGGTATGSVGGAMSTVEKYDPSTNTWSMAPSMPMALASFSATTATDASGATSIYTHGGNSTGAMFAFSASQQRWTTVSATTSTPASPNSGFVGVQDTIYLLAGTTYGYKPATNTWSALASTPAGGDYPGVVAQSGRVYVFEGQNAGSASTAEMYLPDVNSWVSLTRMPMALSGPIAATGGDGRIYVFASGVSAGAGSLAFTP
jgi:hypothetical protein